jgi:uncharacterized phage-like protein YoqJ
MSVVVAATGHRPHKLPQSIWSWIHAQTGEKLIQLEPTYVISGMALGYDQIFAYVALHLGVPLLTAVPCRDQDRVWSPEQRRLYFELLKRATWVHYVTDGPYTSTCMQDRNVWMADRATDVLACWDGSAGGTKNMITYSKLLNRRIHRIDPRKSP